MLLRQKQAALRPKRAHMIAEFDVLAAELQRCFGEGPLPTITHIRSIRRNDLDVVSRQRVSMLRPHSFRSSPTCSEAEEGVPQQRGTE